MPMLFSGHTHCSWWTLPLRALLRLSLERDNEYMGGEERREVQVIPQYVGPKLSFLQVAWLSYESGVHSSWRQTSKRSHAHLFLSAMLRLRAQAAARLSGRNMDKRQVSHRSEHTWTGSHSLHSDVEIGLDYILKLFSPDPHRSEVNVVLSVTKMGSGTGRQCYQCLQMLPSPVGWKSFSWVNGPPYFSLPSQFPWAPSMGNSLIHLCISMSLNQAGSGYIPHRSLLSFQMAKKRGFFHSHIVFPQKCIHES